MAFARYERPITDAAGNIVLSAYVEVRREVPGFPLAVPLYADFDGETTMDNPFHVTDGLATFHAVGGWYRLRVYAPGYERVYRHVPLGTAQAADIDAYAQAGFTWAPESATTTPPATGAIRFDHADVSQAAHAYLDKTTLGGSEASPWLARLVAGGTILMSTGVGIEVAWLIDSVTEESSYIDFALDTASYAGPAGPLSFGDSGFVTVSREGAGDKGDKGDTGDTGPAGTGDRFDLALYVNGKPRPGETVLRHVFSGTGITFPAGAASSAASADVAATAETIFTIARNGVSVGSISFAAASSEGVFTWAADTACVQDDVLTIIAPNPRDATLSNISITIAGVRT